MTDSNDTIAWLSLRDGHLVPIRGLAPADLKRSAKDAIRREEAPLGHLTALNAVLHRLGLEGDFAEYQREGWPALQRFMAEHDLRDRRNLFTGALPYGGFRHSRRALADRLTLGAGRVPRRVFLGFDYDDWDAWGQDVTADPGWIHGRDWRVEDDRFESADPRVVRGWLHRHSVMLLGAGNFISDHLFDPGGSSIVVRLYFVRGYTPAENERQKNIEHVVRTLMKLVAREDRGWVTVHPFNDHLIFLRAEDGTYDMVWRNMRARPSLEAGAFQAWLDRRSDVWLEKWEHEAELRYYAEGGRGLPEFPGYDVMLERHLRALGIYEPAGATAVSTGVSR